MIIENLSVLTIVFDDNRRLHALLSHVSTWCTDINVVIKGERDIDAERICEKFGVVPQYVPYSGQGEGDLSQYFRLPRNSWIWHLTAGEVPTRDLVMRVRAILEEKSESLAAIRYPVKIYSFGKFVERAWGGPWSISYQTRLLNRDLTDFINRTHIHFNFRGEIKDIRYTKNCFLLHPTHAGFSAFIRSHTDYAIAEAKQAQNPIRRAMECVAKASQHDLGFQIDGGEGAVQALAWKTFWLMSALACLTEGQSERIDEYYRMITRDLILREWGAGVNLDELGCGIEDMKS